MPNPQSMKSTVDPRRRIARALLAAIGLALLVTCGGGSEGGARGELAGVVHYSAPVAGARVTVRQYYQDQETIVIGTATTAADGAWSIEAGTYLGDFLVTVEGGTYVEAAGGAVTLDDSAVLHAPVQDFQPAEQRAGVVVTPLTELVWQLGKARQRAAGGEPEYAAAIEHTRALLAAHVGFDPLRTPIAPIDRETPFNEPARHALVLAGLSELAAIAAGELDVTVQAINTRALLTQLVRDASSADARFDGNGAEVLNVGTSCPLANGCSMEQLGCYASCHVYTNTLRSRLAAAILVWLLRDDLGEPNQTGLEKMDVLAWVTGLLDSNPEGLLFGDEGAEPLDRVGPAITWVTPAEGAVVAGDVRVEVDATDALGVASLEVRVGDTVLVDTDPRPEKVIAVLETVGMNDGEVVLTATARDADDNPTTVARTVVADNIDAGTIGGVAVKGRIDGATVTVYTFTDGVRGPVVGTGATIADGSFSNVEIAEGTNGALLVEVGGGGTYVEEAFPNPTVTLDVSERLRTVIPAFVDGSGVGGIVVTPLTSLAVTYLEYRGAAGGPTMAQRWTAAAAAIEAQFGVANIRDIVPLAPAQMTVLTAAARYGLVLVGISRIAYQASNAGGGDAGTFGAAVNGMKVVTAWNRDLSDGCWDGTDDGNDLFYGGTQAFGDQATRRDLANAIAAYLADAAHNPTPFVGVGDVLPLLDTLTSGGGNTAEGSCVMTDPDTVGGQVFDDNGGAFDQTDPVITFQGLTPPANAFVKSVITIDAIATDNLDMRPSLSFVPMSGIVDIDGDSSDSDARGTYDTTTHIDGPMMVELTSTDDSGNSGTGMRSFTIDNTPPVISITGPSTAGGFYQPPVTIAYTVAETNLAAITSTVDGAPIANGGAVSMEGPHTLVVTATDRAGTIATATRGFTIDSIDPVLVVSAPADGAHVQGPVTLSWSITEANPGATSTATLDGSPITSPHTFDTEGVHTLTINATDAAGNPAATVTRTFTLDNTAPILDLTAPAHGSFVRGPVTLTFSATDNVPPVPAIATLDGNAILSPHQVATEGAHTLVVNATDRAGNSAPTVTRTFYLDNTDPTLIVESVAPAGAIVRGLLTVTVRAGDNLAASGSIGSNITVTAAGPSGPVSPSILTPTTVADGSRRLVAAFDTATLPDGNLALTFSITDRAGNDTALAVTRTLDNTAPEPAIVGVTPGAWYAAGPTITFGQSDANPGTTTATLNGVDFTSGSTASTERAHTLVVTATDAAGNSATRTIDFTVDLTDPTFNAPIESQSGQWIRGMYMIRVVANDTLMGIGSLASDITVTAIGPSGAITPMIDPEILATGARQLDVMIDTTSIGGDGDLTLQFGIIDRAGRVRTRTVNHTVDNTAPRITLLPVQNQAGPVYPGFVNETTATIRGQLDQPGGSPVTVTLTANPGGGTTMVTPDASGTFSFVTLALPAGTISIAATAADAAGNAAPPPAGPTSFVVDRSGPTLTFQTSDVVDERTCGLTYANDLDEADSDGTFTGQPVAYDRCAPGVTGAVTTSLVSGTPVIRKYTTRLDSADPMMNPLRWNLSALDNSGGAGVATAGQTIQFRVYRTGQTPPGSWIDTADVLPNGDAVQAAAYVLASQWPELLTHSSTGVASAFVLEVRATDRVGNAGTPAVRTWQHRPLAPPVPLSYTSLAAQTSGEANWAFSIFRHSLTPGPNQVSPVEAMSTSLFIEFVPRALFEFTVWNPHDTPVTVGFFIPGVSGASYAKRVWDTSPWISGAQGTMTAPANGSCPNNPPNTPWPNPGWSARINHAAPYNCNTSSCVCNGTTWNEPIDPPSFPTTAASTVAIGSGASQHPFQVIVLVDGVGMIPRLGLQPTITAGGDHNYFEFTIPASMSPGNSKRARVFVVLPNLDLFNPSTDFQTNPPLESDGPGAEIIKRGGNTIVTTAAFYERWGDCAFGSPNCTTARVRHRYRALVESRLAIPQNALFLNLRARAVAADTATPEPIANEGDGEADHRNDAPFLWEACEALGGYAGGACSPFIATTATSDIN